MAVLSCHMWSAGDGQLINSKDFNFLSYCIYREFLQHVAQSFKLEEMELLSPLTHRIAPPRPVRVHKQDFYFPHPYDHKS